MSVMLARLRLRSDSLWPAAISSWNPCVRTSTGHPGHELLAERVATDHPGKPVR